MTLDECLGTDLETLIDQANGVRKEQVGNDLQLCSILNARSGRCTEDCKFCAQSVFHNTAVTEYPLKSVNEMIDAALDAESIGASRFGIVTSGNLLAPEEVATLVQAVQGIKEQTQLGVCGSLGALTLEQLAQLKQAGLSRFHHNIETSRRFYPAIVSTHDYDQRIETISAAVEVGLEVCSGGIIGMGETWSDRYDMALELCKLGVHSVPINILTPIPGTPLEQSPCLAESDILRTIAMFRILVKSATVKIAAGRECSLGDAQIRGFQAGANGMIIGGYLTVKGDSLDNDQALIKGIQEQWAD